MDVADRLIDAVCQLDYPRDLLEIQVLDDSTDETTTIAERAVRRHALRGVKITFMHRTDRRGFKAGALEAGLKVASGEHVAIFDADFRRHRIFCAARSTSSPMRRLRWCRRAGDISTRTTRC